jgi:hypothetical protein
MKPSPCSTALRLSLVGLLTVLTLWQAGCRQSQPELNEDPPGWRRVAVDGIYSLAVPPDTSNTIYPSVENNSAIFKSASLEMHIGFAGLPTSSKPETARVKTRIDGHAAEIMRSMGSSPPWVHPLWVTAQISDVGEFEVHRDKLAVMANCADEKAQDVAERIVRSIRFLPPAPKPRALPPPPPPPPS